MVSEKVGEMAEDLVKLVSEVWAVLAVLKVAVWEVL